MTRMKTLMERYDLSQTCEYLKARDRFLILTHRRPDGDTMGSAAALCRGLRAIGKTAYVAENEDDTPRLSFLCGELYAPDGYRPQTLVSADVADEALLPPSMDEYCGRVGLALDHHGTNRAFAEAGLVRASACATGEIVFEVLEAMGAPISLPVWEALYTAVATDTGCFKYSNTTPLAHRIAADAIANGINFLKINREFFEKKSKARFKLERALYDGLIFSRDGLSCAVALTRAQIDETNANGDDLDNLSTLTMALENVLVGIVLTENEDGSYKVSVRTHRPVDASAICARFGGGGHPRASGCTMHCDGREALAKLMEAAHAQIAATDLSLADV